MHQQQSMTGKHEERSFGASTLPVGSHTPVSPGRSTPSRPDTSRSALEHSPWLHCENPPAPMLSLGAHTPSTTTVIPRQPPNHHPVTLHVARSARAKRLQTLNPKLIRERSTLTCGRTGG